MGYDVRFNKKTHAAYVRGRWKSCAIWLPTFGGLLAGASYAHFRAGWPQWVFIVALLLFLWVLTTGFLGAVADTLDYIRRHGRR